MSAVGDKFKELTNAGWNASNRAAYDKWYRRVLAFLERTLPSEVAAFEKIRSDARYENDFTYARSSLLGMLEGLAADQRETEDAMAASSPSGPTPTRIAAPSLSKKVFMVHGHDNAAKEAVARFLERLGLEPVILHEQPNEGRTVIEKFEHHADVGFAVVLLTPDDVGAAASEPDKLKARARQNVVLELGYFLGALRRSRVCALYKGGVEIPSDYQGVLYVEMDDKGGWRTRLAQELSNAGLKINIEALLKS